MKDVEIYRKKVTPDFHVVGQVDWNKCYFEPSSPTIRIQMMEHGEKLHKRIG